MARIRIDKGMAAAAICSAATAMFALLHHRAYAADSSAAVPRYISYSGHLSRDGVALEGTAELVFRLYDSEDTDAIWEETQTVGVHNGEFQALFGSTSTTSSNDLVTALEAYDDVYLAIAVVTTGGEVALSGRQRFVPTAFAMWSQAGTATFSVHVGTRITGTRSDGKTTAPLIVKSSSAKLLADGDSIDSYASVAFKLNVGSGQPVTIDAGVTVGADVVANSYAGVFQVNGKDALTAEDGHLYVNQNGDFDTVSLDGDVANYSSYVSKPDLTVKGDLTATGALTASTGAGTFTGALTTKASLTVENDGNIDVAGTSYVGLVARTCDNALTCSCSSGEVAVGGGGYCGSTAYEISDTYRDSNDETKWTLERNSGSTSSKFTQVMCARVGG